MWMHAFNHKITKPLSYQNPISKSKAAGEDTVLNSLYNILMMGFSFIHCDKKPTSRILMRNKL